MSIITMTNRTRMFLFLFGLLMESTIALAIRDTSSRIFFQGSASSSFPPPTPLAMKPKRIPLTQQPHFRSHRSAQFATASPLFSFRGTSAAAASTIKNLAVVKAVSPFQRTLLAFRGGAAGLTVKRVAKTILDDVAASKTKSWSVLFLAILLETFASTLSKRARDTANPGLFATAVSINLLSLCAFCTCLGNLDVGVAYAVWAALGTVIVTAAGIVFFHETCDPFKLVSILFVIAGVVGLNLRG